MARNYENRTVITPAEPGWRVHQYWSLDTVTGKDDFATECLPIIAWATTVMTSVNDPDECTNARTDEVASTDAIVWTGAASTPGKIVDRGGGILLSDLEADATSTVFVTQAPWETVPHDKDGLAGILAELRRRNAAPTHQ